MKVGFAGLGRMGMAITERLQAQGLQVSAWNRTPRQAPAGVGMVANLCDMAQECDVVLVMVSDDAAALSVYQQLLARPVPGTVFVEMGTNRVDTIHKVAAQVHQAGGRFLDMPVSGTVGPARQGQLLALAGGDAELLQYLDPLIRALARKVVHCGPVGTGTVMKHSVNGLLGVYFAALSEALGMGAAAGLKPQDMLEVIQDTPAGLPALGIKIPVILGEQAPVAYSVKGVCKDLDVITASARAQGVATPLTLAALATFQAVAAQGQADQDLAIVARAQLGPVAGR